MKPWKWLWPLLEFHDLLFLLSKLFFCWHNATMYGSLGLSLFKHNAIWIYLPYINVRIVYYIVLPSRFRLFDLKNVLENRHHVQKGWASILEPGKNEWCRKVSNLPVSHRLKRNLITVMFLFCPPVSSLNLEKFGYLATKKYILRWWLTCLSRMV